MTAYGQFCPIAKAMEVLGDKWTILIVRELLLGTSRFNDFQRALSRISPTILTKRLKQLEAAGVVVRKRLSGQNGYEYRLSASGKDLMPVIEHLAVWGMRWVREQFRDDELDVELLMWDIRRRLNVDRLPDGQTVLLFTFDGLEKYRKWWLIVNGEDVDLCTENPGKDVDLYITTDARTLINVWEGREELSSALKDERIVTVGDRHLMQTIKDWLGQSLAVILLERHGGLPEMPSA